MTHTDQKLLGIYNDGLCTLFQMPTYYYLRRFVESMPTLDDTNTGWVTIGPATEVTLRLQADDYEVASMTIDGTIYKINAPPTETFDVIFTTKKGREDWYLVTTEDYAYASHYEIINYKGPQITHYRY